ncbi:hypothetical protein LCGC14_0315560 [marine sediment metagenome]|uniref:Uncharacterized protein n=1 Tax=marine sediment metagenome TaxID=412755 RepID=A0A0F9W821_9ZZZZ|nr:hypothetical protein [Phycisphaerae bacterium]HDZ44577.1 hypothetical protein [Phycisphaerae bacterium]
MPTQRFNALTVRPPLTVTWFVLIAILAGTLTADIVYTKDGRKIQGAVSHEADTVIIKTDDGVVVIPADQVVHIAVETVDEPVDEPAETTPKPPPPPPAPPEGDAAAAAAAKRFSQDKATRPESIVFMLMRRLAATPRGGDVSELRRRVKIWQAKAHDRERRIGGKWLRPGDVTIRRQKFYKEMETLTELSRDLAAVKDKHTDTDKDRKKAEKKRARLRSQIATAMRKTAETWPDEEIRNFLRGIAYYQVKNYASAAKAFERARKSNPLVAAYHQGEGLALVMVEGRELDGVAALVKELHLRRDKPEVARRLSEALKKVPGSKTHENVFKDARALVNSYPDNWLRAPRRSRRMTWQMPGRAGWPSRDNKLPEPPYDRLVVRQAIGIPVDESVLLVDREVVEDALEVFVQIDAETLVPAQVGKSRRQPPRGQTRKLALVTVGDHTFTPVAISADAVFKAGDAVKAFGLGVFPEMGTTVRPLETDLTEVRGKLVPRTRLVAGESASAVLTDDRRLVGVLAGRTDAAAKRGGRGNFIPLKALKTLLSKRSDARYRSSFGARARREVTPTPAPGTHFVVLAVFGEKLD